MIKFLLSMTGLLIPVILSAQLYWQNVDSQFGPLPDSMHVYYTCDSLGSKPNVAYYVKVSLRNPEIIFDT